MLETSETLLGILVLLVKKEKRWKSVRKAREKCKRKTFELRMGALNVGSMTGKRKELADIIER